MYTCSARTVSHGPADTCKGRECWCGRVCGHGCACGLPSSLADSFVGHVPLSMRETPGNRGRHHQGNMAKAGALATCRWVPAEPAQQGVSRAGEPSLALRNLAPCSASCLPLYPSPTRPPRHIAAMHATAARNNSDKISRSCYASIAFMRLLLGRLAGWPHPRQAARGQGPHQRAARLGPASSSFRGGTRSCPRPSCACARCLHHHHPQLRPCCGRCRALRSRPQPAGHGSGRGADPEEPRDAQAGGRGRGMALSLFHCVQGRQPERGH